MRIRTLLCCGVIFVIAGCKPAAESPKNEPAKPAAVSTDEKSKPTYEAELKWAREVAEGYLRVAGPDFKSSEALAWASPQWRERHEKGSTIRYYGFKDFTIANTSMAPNGKQVVFRGTVNATSYGAWTPSSGGGEDPNFRGTIPFTLRVIEDPKDGRWQVDSLQYEEPPKTGEAK